MSNLISWHLSSAFNFSGREARRHFWPWLGLVFMVAVVMLVLGILTISIVVERPLTVKETINVSSVIVLISFILVASSVARRLHDRGLPGAIGLAPVSVLLIILLVLNIDSNRELSISSIEYLPQLLILYSLAILALIAILILPSEGKDNRYGVQHHALQEGLGG